MATHRVFLLSPARTDGKRARLLLRDGAELALARQLRDSAGGAPLGEVFTFTSELYFRGKLVYARTFARAPTGGSGVLIITAGRGLLPPETPVTAAALRAMGAIEVDAAEPRFRDPLVADTVALAGRLGADDQVVLLGSIASDKYVGPLREALGDRLHFPEEFVGRGDMSRGGLLLRHAEAGRELRYIPLSGAARRGRRPPRLDDSGTVPPRARRRPRPPSDPPPHAARR